MIAYGPGFQNAQVALDGNRKFARRRGERMQSRKECKKLEIDIMPRGFHLDYNPSECQGDKKMKIMRRWREIGVETLESRWGQGSSVIRERGYGGEMSRKDRRREIRYSIELNRIEKADFNFIFSF